MGKLLIAIDTMFYYDREVLKGIKSKLDELQLRMTVHVESLENSKAILSQTWDMIIIDYDKADTHRIIPRLKGTVLLYSSHQIINPPEGTSTLVNDNEQFAYLAIGQFIQSDIKNVCFYKDLPEENAAWALERESAFREGAVHSELNYLPDAVASIRAGAFPLGIYCSSDRSARKLAILCEELGVSVPAEVSIIGTDYDDTERSISPLPLSSINIDPYQLGQACLEAVVKIRRFKRIVHEKYQPVTLVHECSTTGEHDGDDVVNRALYYLHNNYHLNIKVQQVIDFCRVSRKTLDNRFYAVKGITVHQYLSDLRIAKSKKLLKTTRDTIESIAFQCGYPNQSYLYQVFRKQFSYTPLQYRNGVVD